MMDRKELLAWLREGRDDVLETLWQRADDARRSAVGEAVHLRGLIEVSNHCSRRCHYCGLRVDNRDLERYRMTAEEILVCARQASQFGYGTVVLQAGEDPGLFTEWVASVVRDIKRETGLAITLSLGERDAADLASWRAAGADRYLLRFETSNRDLFARIHPPPAGRPVHDRIVQLRELRRLGFEVGSGVMVGIPGQTYDDLANDLAIFQELDLDMIGIGPFIPHPATPLASAARAADTGHDWVPATESMTLKMVALSRILCPRANIPSTTALATLNLAHGRELGLQRGANVLMPNMTPTRYRIHYEIYPAKACIQETAAQCHGCIRGRILSIGRTVGIGPGSARQSL